MINEETGNLRPASPFYAPRHLRFSGTKSRRGAKGRKLRLIWHLFTRQVDITNVCIAPAALCSARRKPWLPCSMMPRYGAALLLGDSDRRGQWQQRGRCDGRLRTPGRQSAYDVPAGRPRCARPACGCRRLDDQRWAGALHDRDVGAGRAARVQPTGAVGWTTEGRPALFMTAT